MRAERMDGIASKNRDQSVEEGLRRWNEMINATEFVRAKPMLMTPYVF